MSGLRIISTTSPLGVVEVHDQDRYERTHPDAAVTTCGECGRSWDDAVVTGWTPAPSARCPFEYEHEQEYVGRHRLDSKRSDQTWLGCHTCMERIS